MSRKDIEGRLVASWNRRQGSPELHAQIQELEALVEKLRASNQRLLALSRDQSDEHHQKLEEERGLVVKVARELERAQGQIGRLENEREELRAEVRKLRGEVAKLRKGR